MEVEKNLEKKLIQMQEKIFRKFWKNNKNVQQKTLQINFDSKYSGKNAKNIFGEN